MSFPGWPSEYRSQRSQQFCDWKGNRVAAKARRYIYDAFRTISLSRNLVDTVHRSHAHLGVDNIQSILRGPAVGDPTYVKMLVTVYLAVHNFRWPHDQGWVMNINHSTQYQSLLNRSPDGSGLYWQTTDDQERYPMGPQSHRSKCIWK